MRVNITLKCQTCGQETYHTTKNKKTHPDRMEVQKYCPKCQVRTNHKEKK